MAVYVDSLFDTTWADKKKWPYNKSCHMTADNTSELNDFAQRLGLSLHWIQFPGTWKEHYDLTESKRKLAVKLGAIEKD